MHLRRATCLSTVLGLSLLLVWAACSLSPKPRYANHRVAKKTSKSPPRSENDGKKASPTVADDQLDAILSRDDIDKRQALYPLQNQTRRAKLAASIRGFLGARYQLGGLNTKAVDCSGLVKAVFQEVDGVELPHKVAEMYRLGVAVERQALAAGDLVFFSNSRRHQIDHVGIYLSEKNFVHSTVGDGVTISNLDDEYWQRRYVGGRRL